MESTDAQDEAVRIGVSQTAFWTEKEPSTSQLAEESLRSNATTKSNVSSDEDDERKEDDDGEFPYEVFETVTAELSDTVLQALSPEALDYKLIDIQETLSIKISRKGESHFLKGRYQDILEAEKTLLKSVPTQPPTQATGTTSRSSSEEAGPRRSQTKVVQCDTRNDAVRTQSLERHREKNTETRPLLSEQQGEQNADTQHMSERYGERNAETRQHPPKQHGKRNASTGPQLPEGPGQMNAGTKTQVLKHCQHGGEEAATRAQSSAAERDGEKSTPRSEFPEQPYFENADLSIQRVEENEVKRKHSPEPPLLEKDGTKSSLEQPGDKNGDQRSRTSEQHDENNHASLRPHMLEQHDESNASTKPHMSEQHDENNAGTRQHMSKQHDEENNAGIGMQATEQHGANASTRSHTSEQHDGKIIGMRTTMQEQHGEKNACMSTQSPGGRGEMNASTSLPEETDRESAASASHTQNGPRRSYPTSSNTEQGKTDQKNADTKRHMSEQHGQGNTDKKQRTNSMSEQNDKRTADTKLRTSEQHDGKNAGTKPPVSEHNGDKKDGTKLHVPEQDDGPNATTKLHVPEQDDGPNSSTRLNVPEQDDGPNASTKLHVPGQDDGPNASIKLHVPEQDDGPNSSTKLHVPEQDDGPNASTKLYVPQQDDERKAGTKPHVSGNHSEKKDGTKRHMSEQHVEKNLGTKPHMSEKHGEKNARTKRHLSEQHDEKKATTSPHLLEQRDEQNAGTNPHRSKHRGAKDAGMEKHDLKQHGADAGTKPLMSERRGVGTGTGTDLPEGPGEMHPSTRHRLSEESDRKNAASASHTRRKPRHSYSTASNTETGKEVQQEPLPGRDVDVMYRARKSNILVHVYYADITKLKVEGIVSAANSLLKGDRGGVSGAIGKAGGTELRQDCEKWIKKHGPLKVTRTAVTRAGCLLCRAVIHALGPRLTNDRDLMDCFSALHRTFINCLWTAEQNELRSVAIPAISSGNFGVPQHYVSQKLFDACREFCIGQHKQSHLRHIHLVDLNEDHVNHLRILFGIDTSEFEALPVATTLDGETGIRGEDAGQAHITMTEGSHSLQEHAQQQAHRNDEANNEHKNRHHMGSATVKSGPSSRAATAGSFDTNCMQQPGKDSRKLNASATTGDYGNGSTGQPSQQRQQRRRKRNTGESDTSGHNQDARRPDRDREEQCPICFEVPTAKEKTELPCQHIFCKTCKDQAFALKPVCPVCGAIYGILKGTQPDGEMKVQFDSSLSLPGFGRNTRAIVITYNFRNGTQQDHHPSPGRHYWGTTRTAYLPDNPEGRHVLGLLRQAFEARLIFTIGTSTTTGSQDQVTWNDIHHKTNINGGSACFGYPDRTYLTRVKDELAAKGIK